MSITSKIQSLLTFINNQTGKEDTDLTSAIKSLASGGGGDIDWSEIGYDSAPDSVKEWVAYAKQIKDEWTPTRGNFNGDKTLYIFPKGISSARSDMSSYFRNTMLTEIDAVNDYSGSIGCSWCFAYNVGLRRIKFSADNINNGNNMCRDDSLLEDVIIIGNVLSGDFGEAFRGCSKLKNVSLPSTSGVTSFSNAFRGVGDVTISELDMSSNKSNYMLFDSSWLTIAPAMINTQNVTDWSRCFAYTNLTTVGVLNFSSATTLNNMFTSVSTLTGDSINNILASCATVGSAYTRNKTLTELGLNNRYSASMIQGLSNYQTFVNAGWTIGWT